MPGRIRVGAKNETTGRSIANERAPGIVLKALKNFPASLMVLAPYLLLFLPSAFLNENREIGFILFTLLLALVGVFGVECVAFLGRSVSRRGNLRMHLISNAHILEVARARRFFVAGIIAILIGIVASNGSALLGVGTIEGQVGGGYSGPLASLLTPFQGYIVVGLALLAWGYSLGGASSRSFGIWLSLAIASRVAYVIQLGITIQLLRFLIVAVVLLIFLGIIRIKASIIFGAIVAIAWPIFFEFRNQLRMERGIWVDPYLGAFDRLRYDLQISAAADIPPGQDIGQVQGIEVLRFGVIPGFLDSERGPVDTGGLINSVLLGGTMESSFTFLPVATAYVLEGPVGMMAIFGIFAILAAIFLRASPGFSAWRVVFFCLLLSGPLGWFSVPPNSIIGFLQDLVATVPFMLCVYAFGGLRGERRSLALSR